MAHGVDPDQTLHSASSLFAQAYLSENLGLIRYVNRERFTLASKEAWLDRANFKAELGLRCPH